MVQVFRSLLRESVIWVLLLVLAHLLNIMFLRKWNCGLVLSAG